MLAVPWFVPSYSVEEVDAVYEGDITYVKNNVFEELDSIKDKIGCFKLEKGDNMWREAVAVHDSYFKLPMTLEKPINRAYYKFVEIIRTCIIQPPKKSFHMCEAPGGFIQAVMDEFKNSTKEVYCSSLKDSNAPMFSALCAQSGVNVLSCDNNDVTDKLVRDMHVKEIYSNSCDLITADGAMDNDSNPEMTEENSVNLILSEILLAFSLQKEGGTFVVKLFGLRLLITYKLIAMLCHCYNHVQILKPLTSRGVNDERYVVCQGFNPCKSKIFEDIDTSKKIYDIFKLDECWFKELENIAVQFANNQYMYIQKTLNHRSSGKGQGKGRGRGRGRGIQKT